MADITIRFIDGELREIIGEPGFGSDVIFSDSGEIPCGGQPIDPICPHCGCSMSKDWERDPMNHCFRGIWRCSCREDSAAGSAKPCGPG